MQAEAFEKDFDSVSPSPIIAFDRTWNSHNQFGKKNQRRSRRQLNLPPPVFKSKKQKQLAKQKLQKQQQQNLKEQNLIPQEIILDNNRRVYRTPRMGWDSMVRRVVQYGYEKMQKPSEYDEFGRPQWRGVDGVISQLQRYAGLTGWRSKKVIKEIIQKCNENVNFDAGKRTTMCLPRKRKLNQADVDIAGKMLRTGSSTAWAATAINNRISFMGRGEKAKVTRRTLERTLKKKYDAKVHRRQSKGTGSKDKNSTWAKSRLSLNEQLMMQLS